MNEKTVIALRNGDVKAFEELFTQYFGKVKYFILGILKSEEDAEELAQDIFVRLWLKRSALDPSKSFNAFLYTMARNAAFNFLKNQFIRETYLREQSSEDSVCTTEEDLMVRETALIIEMTVSRMPQQRQTIYRMSRNDGIPNEQIADRLGISRKTVENQISLALKDLRTVVNCLVMFFPGSISAVNCIIGEMENKQL